MDDQFASRVMSDRGNAFAANQINRDQAIGLATAKRTRRLDAISSAADLAARMAEQLDSILGRFTGAGAEQPVSGACPPVRVSYTNELDRLEDNLKRISLAIEQMEEFA